MGLGPKLHIQPCSCAALYRATYIYSLGGFGGWGGGCPNSHIMLNHSILQADSGWFLPCSSAVQILRHLEHVQAAVLEPCRTPAEISTQSNTRNSASVRISPQSALMASFHAQLAVAEAMQERTTMPHLTYRGHLLGLAPTYPYLHPYTYMHPCRPKPTLGFRVEFVSPALIP